MHYLIPSIEAKIEVLEEQLETLEFNTSEYNRVYNKLSGLQEQLGDLYREDTLGMNDHAQMLDEEVRFEEEDEDEREREWMAGH